MVPALMNMLGRLLSGLGPLGTLIMAVLPFVGYYLMKQRADGLAAAAESLRAALKATQDAAAAAAKRRTAAKKAEDAAAAAKAKADEEAKAAAAVIEEKAAEVAEVKRKRGVGAAASARAKQVRAAKQAGTALLILAFLTHTTSVRADACTDGFSLKAGDKAPCAAECLPAEDLEVLLEDSVQCERLRLDHDTVLKKHTADVTAFSTKLALCDQHVAKLEKQLADVTVVPPAETSTSTYILIGIGVFVAGMAAGSALVYKFDR